MRGERRIQKTDGIYRASLRGESTHFRDRVQTVAADFLQGGHRANPGRDMLIETRREIERSWSDVAELLQSHGESALAKAVRQFAHRMPPPATEQDLIAQGLIRNRLHRTQEQIRTPQR